MHIDEVFFSPIFRHPNQGCYVRKIMTNRTELVRKSSNEMLQRSKGKSTVFSDLGRGQSKHFFKNRKKWWALLFPNSWLFEENILVYTYTRRIFFLPELDRQGQRSLFHTKSLKGTHFVCLQLLRRVSFSKFLEKHLWAGKNVSLDYRPSIFLLHLHSKRYWNHVTSSWADIRSGTWWSQA